MNRQGLLFQLSDSAAELSVETAGRLRQAGRPTAEDIHAYRVATKRLRAYWRLVHPAIGKVRARSHARDLRDSARALALQRDAFVRLALFEQLREDAGHRSARAVSFVQEELFGASWDDARGQMDISACEHALMTDADRWAAIVAEPVAAVDESVVRAGLETTYAKARRLGRAAVVMDTNAGYHRWRRWVKYAYYQIDWFHSRYPSVPDKYARRLKRLGSVVGRLHDTHHLLDEIDERSVRTSSPRAVRRARNLLRRREEELKREARRLAKKALTTEPPLIAYDVLTAVRGGLEDEDTVHRLEFISLADHEGDGAAPAASAADLH